MGHTDTVGAMPPREERVGCADHETYDDDCVACYLRNGGRMD